MLNENQNRIPLLEAIIRHVQKRPVPFHVPGHKMGRGVVSEFGNWLDAALKLDITELPGLDDLHAPSDSILTAQELAAAAFGAEQTFFLVNGSTSGNYAMILSTCKPGDRLIVARNFHKSVIQACTLGNIHPVYMDLPIDKDIQSAGPVPVESVEMAIQKYPDAKAVLITSPTYQGIYSPIREIAEIVHRAGMILLVDEAHGAHLHFHPQLHKYAALVQGADLVVQSTHKMLGSLTQTAMLHVNGKGVDLQRLAKYVSFSQTSSPSYLLLASLDAARYVMAMEGERLLSRGMAQLQDFHAAAKRWKWIQLVPRKEDRDPFKLIFRLKRGTPAFAEEWLRTNHGIFFEMATPDHLLAVASYADTKGMMEKLLRALDALDQWLDRFDVATADMSHSSDDAFLLPFQPSVKEPVLGLREVEDSNWEWVNIERSCGRIAYHFVAPYPPGIPIICPGERIESHMIKKILSCIQQRGNVQGLGGSNKTQIAVCIEEK
ncbi:aminotransferase class I/II-fold pyridoxal phosphate-dependent enzyme [Fodinisporobacter ferrooxydans]|uniref:Aminotransferase class I/II-fold pyridoxal phosphate-dependent enzyme n=1 Tax=Fodinisporobacter ferrooxydans TaxID=2901836 RepID=A0ABY4CMT4_9BACL|nr:aminotransferase class I/II-fold pyridoxal phosphate-dependent enzyme [Alicyclobacillaceae bacterium MYW30-H2]